MIRALVDFALKSRWLVLGGVVVLTAWGIVSFRNLPVEAYPDVANNYVQIITQWPGRSPRRSSARSPCRSKSRWPAFPTSPICAPPRWPAFPA